MGTKDTKVKTEEVKLIFNLIKSKNKKLKIFKDGDHCISDVPRDMRQEVLKVVVKWFKETL